VHCCRSPDWGAPRSLPRPLFVIPNVAPCAAQRGASGLRSRRLLRRMDASRSSKQRRLARHYRRRAGFPAIALAKAGLCAPPHVILSGRRREGDGAREGSRPPRTARTQYPPSSQSVSVLSSSLSSSLPAAPCSLLTTHYLLTPPTPRDTMDQAPSHSSWPFRNTRISPRARHRTEV
jgi:hypothetical protein